MDCKSIGKANPDIAGTGILVAFVIQSLIAVILSGYAWMLSSRLPQRGEEADPDAQNAGGADENTAPEWLRPILPVLRMIISSPTAITRRVQDLSRKFFPRFLTVPKPEGGKSSSHAFDWLLGKQPQQPPRLRNGGSSIEHEDTPTTRRLEFANRILLAGSDSQTFTGIALLISALIQSQTLTLYHMHIIYDTISLVVISNCAASVCIFGDGLIKGYTRLALISVWAVLFIAYFSLFAARLQKWDSEVPFQCYKTTATTLPNSSHPYVDNIYIAFTFLYIVGSFCYAMVLSLRSRDQLRKKRLGTGLSLPSSTRVPKSRIPEPTAMALETLEHMLTLLNAARIPVPDMHRAILSVAMLQGPLHIHSIFALRASNERYLEDGSSEKSWGFGQIVAVVLLGANILPIVDGIAEYQLKKATEAVRNRDEEHLAGNQITIQVVAQDTVNAGASLVENHNAGSGITPANGA